MLLKVSRLAERLTKESGVLDVVKGIGGKALNALGPIGLGLDALGSVKNVAQGTGPQASAARMAGDKPYGL